MGLSFLNKKTWHPGSFGNIEKVWIAEESQRARERKIIESRKKLKEERQMDELKKLQVDAGLIPESHLQRLDWMYQGPETRTDITTAEEYLIGKPIKEEKTEKDKNKFIPVFQESYSNPNNERFTKIHEDPLSIMKKEEARQRKEIEENPYKMKLLLKDIEKEIFGEKKEKKAKKDKKHKKDKKDKKHRRQRSSSSSRNTHKRDKSLKEPQLVITTPSMAALKNKGADTFGLVDKHGNKISINNNKDLGPDLSLYNERVKQMEKDRDLMRKQTPKSKYFSNKAHHKNLSQEEREQLIHEMQKKAEIHDLRKSLKSQENIGKITESLDKVKLKETPTSSRPDFIRKMEKDVYSGNITLEERIKRNKHYISADKI